MKKRVAKNSNISTTKPTSPKFDFDEYRNMKTLQKLPINNLFLETLAKDLIEWALNNDDALRISQFYGSKHMTRDDFMRLMNKNETLREAYDFAIETLGQRREIGWIKGDYEGSAISATLAHYCSVAKEQAEYKAALRQKAEVDRGGNITVVLPPIPDSPLVPAKKTKEIDGEGVN